MKDSLIIAGCCYSEWATTPIHLAQVNTLDAEASLWFGQLQIFMHELFPSSPTTLVTVKE
jgi:hypothetical protein